MKFGALKYNLLDKIIGVQGIDILKKIDNLLTPNKQLDKSVFKTTDGQNQMLFKSEEDIVAGRILSDDELNAEEDKWLSE